MCWQRKMCHWHRHVEFEDKFVDVSNWSQTVLEILLIHENTKINYWRRKIQECSRNFRTIICLIINVNSFVKSLNRLQVNMVLSVCFQKAIRIPKLNPCFPPYNFEHINSKVATPTLIITNVQGRQKLRW